MIVAETCRQFLEDCGVNPDRLALEWASAAEAPRFVELITGYVARIKDTGPLGSAEGEVDAKTMRRRLKAAVKAAGARKPRTVLGNLAKRLAKEGDYSKEAIAKGVSSKILPALRAERIAAEALMLLDNESMTASELAKACGASEEELEKLLATMVKRGKVREEGGRYAAVS